MQRIRAWLLWPVLFFLGALDRETPLARVLLIIPAVVVSGWKGLLLHFGVGKQDALDIPSQCWGFCDPLLVWDSEGSFKHRATDYLVEWVRKRPQRAAKLGSMVILVLVVVAAVGWMI